MKFNLNKGKLIPQTLERYQNNKENPMNIKNVLKSVISATLLATLASCSNGANKSGLTSIDALSIASDATLTKEQKAEKLAKASEQLLTAQGFAYASDVADLSLQTDSANIRAQFIKAILAPIMAHKGIYKRVKPLSDLDVKATEEYAKSLAKFEEETPNSTVKEFLLDGQADIKTESDIQAYLDSISDSFKAIREFAKNNKNSELTFTASDSLYQAMMNRSQKACEVRQTGNYQYETNCPDIKNVMEIGLNRADFEAIQQMASGNELYFALVNSYNLTGAIDKALSSQGKTEDTQKVIEDLLKNKEFATLRGGNGFQKVKSMGLDAIAGARWIMKNKNTLCPMGATHPKNRVGMLLNNGLCVEKSNAAEDSKSLSLASDVLMGKVMENVEIGRQESWKYVGTAWPNGEYKKIVKEGYITSVKPVAIFESPIADLRNILPQTYDKCGKATSFKDSSLAGVFVKNDLNALLLKTAECDKK
jgi:hypothetical protein